MDLIEGETLAARLEKGALPALDVLRLGSQIAVQFVMKDGQVFKQDGVMTQAFFHGGPVNGWRIR